MPEPESESEKAGRPFKNAKPSAPVIAAASELVRLELALKNKLHVDDAELEHLRGLPPDAGVILISNHADEMDPRICLELSRLSGKRFISMCNREAFDELSGMAGWVLQHLGHFSVERGAHDSHAKQYAIDIVKNGEQILVIFPEGEIFYLNEKIQPFHSGVVEISMQALLQQREKNPDWKAFIVPMALKYHHHGPIEDALEHRIEKMEIHLNFKPSKEESFTTRLRRIQKTLLAMEETAHNIRQELQHDLFEEITRTEEAILSEIEATHQEIKVHPSQLIDKAWQLGAAIREELASDDSNQEELKKELADLKEVAQLTSWHPDYIEEKASFDRLAELVLKLERELFKVKRPKQLTRRDVHVTISTPIDISSFVQDYETDAHAFRHSFTEDLQKKVQAMVDRLVEKCEQH